MLTFILNSGYQSSHSDYTFLMYKQTLSDRPRVKGRAAILQRLAPGQPDPKRILKHKVYTFTFFTDGETDAFCSVHKMKTPPVASPVTGFGTAQYLHAHFIKDFDFTTPLQRCLLHYFLKSSWF